MVKVSGSLAMIGSVLPGYCHSCSAGEQIEGYCHSGSAGEQIEGYCHSGSATSRGYRRKSRVVPRGYSQNVSAPGQLVSNRCSKIFRAGRSPRASSRDWREH